jgi:hypothetical protein
VEFSLKRDLRALSFDIYILSHPSEAKRWKANKS